MHTICVIPRGKVRAERRGTLAWMLVQACRVGVQLRISQELDVPPSDRRRGAPVDRHRRAG